MTERDQIVVNHLCKSLPNELGCEIASISNLAERCERLSRIMKDVYASCRLTVDIFFLSLLDDLSEVLVSTFVSDIVVELRKQIESLIGPFFWKDQETPCFQSKENMLQYIRDLEECQRKCRFFLQNDCMGFFVRLIDETESHILEVTTAQTIDEELSKTLMSCFQSVYLHLVPCLYRIIDEDECIIDLTQSDQVRHLKSLCTELRLLIQYYVLFDLRPFLGEDSGILLQHVQLVLYQSISNFGGSIEFHLGEPLPSLKGKETEFQRMLDGFFQERIYEAFITIKDDIDWELETREELYGYDGYDIDGYKTGIKVMYSKLEQMYRGYRKKAYL